MSRRGWVGWIEDHRGLVGSVALWVAFTLAIGTAIVTGGSNGAAGASGNAVAAGRVAASKQGKVGSGKNGHRGAKAAKGTVAGTNGGQPGGGPPGGVAPQPSTSPGGPPIVPGTSPAPACTKQPSTETGVSDTSITVGQIITDSSNIPQQFHPAYEGLSAYVKLVNDRGGICGRQLVIDINNDGANPSAHDYQSMAQRDFAFVANESILDGFDYDSSPPFNPKYRDNRTGEYVPDVGGLALAYGRSQSPMHAGVIGSVSPVLVGGGQFSYYVDHAAHPCKKAGVVYLVEPTNASKDQADLGKAALEASWGGNFGAGNVETYQASLASPDLVYRGIVENMIRDGVNCAFSYLDLASNVNFVKALNEEGVWPPASCNRLDTSQCFGVVWVPFSAYDPAFIQGAGSAATGVVSFIPHLPLDETSNPAMQSYLQALALCNAARFAGCSRGDAQPSTFSLLGFASGIMFVEAVEACGGAPTRACVMTYLRGIQGFNAGGLLGGNSPFKCTTASFSGFGTYCWKWIFYSSVAVQVKCAQATLACFDRIRPTSGFFVDTLHVAR